MIQPFILPQLGLTMEEATVVTWLVRDGETVTEDQEVLEIMTDKTTVALKAPASGRIRLLVQPDDVIPIGALLAEILTAGETEESAAVDPAGTAAAGASRERLQATPGVRKLAAGLGVDLAGVAGTGPGGRILPGDVEAAARAGKSTQADAAAPPPAVPGHAAPSPAAEEAEYVELPLTGVRRVIAQNLRRSLAQAAQVTATMEVDCTQLGYLKAALGERGHSVSFNHVIAYILVRVLPNHPRLNGTLVNDVIRQYSAVHLGIAVDLDGAVIVPVLRNAHRMSLSEFSAAARDLVLRARSGSLLPEEGRGSSFTISNTGNFPIDGFTPVLNPPEIALLGLGGIQDKVYAVAGRPEVRRGVTASVTYDHCAVDGVDVARFMTDLRQRLESAHVELAGEVV